MRWRMALRVFKPAPSLKPRQKTKNLAAHRYIFSVNALIHRFMALAKPPEHHHAESAQCERGRFGHRGGGEIQPAKSLVGSGGGQQRAGSSSPGVYDTKQAVTVGAGGINNCIYPAEIYGQANRPIGA